MPYRKKKIERDEAGNPLPPVPPRASWPLELGIYALILGTPLAIGTVHVWTVLAMLALACTTFLFLLLRTRRRRVPVKLFPFGCVLLGAVAVTALQLVPLPAALVGGLNPGAGEVFERVLAGTPLADAWRPFSLAAPLTALELMKILACALAFIVVVNYFTDRHRARRLLKTVAWSGFLVALIGFFSKLFMATAIWGFYPLPKEVFFFSTFVNPNHLAGFLLLCAPVSLGLALSARGRQDRALFGFMGVIMGVAVFMSLSRGGMVAFAAGMVFLIVFAATRRARRLQHTALTQAAAALVLLVAGYLAYDAVLKEMRTLGDLDAVREETKIRSWGDVPALILDHPTLGLGRGAYVTVYPRYKTVENCSTFTHAENETLQYLADFGPVFGLLFLLGLAFAFALGLARARHSFSMGGCLAGLFAVFIHNQVDFNLETGAVLLVFSILFGVVAVAPFSHAGKPRDFETRPRLGRALAWALVGGAILAGAALSPWAAHNDLGRLTAAVLAEQQGPQAKACDDSALGQAACRMLDHYPADYLTPLILGRAQLGQKPPDLKGAMRWLTAAMWLNPRDPESHRLAGRALYLAGQHEQALVEYRLAAQCDSKLQLATIAEVLRLTNDAQAAITATPVEAQAYLRTARILNTLGRKSGAHDAAHRALEEDGNLLAALDLLAQLALEMDQLDEATDLAKRSIEVDAQHDRGWGVRGQVLARKGKLAEAEQVLREGWTAIPDSTLLANQLVELLIHQKRYKDAEVVATRMQTFAAGDDRSQAKLFMVVGRIKEAREMYFEARQSYRQAIDIEPDNLFHLYRLGRMEEKVGAWDEAVRIYQKLRERRFRAEEMIERLDIVLKAKAIEQNRVRFDALVKPD